jgi:GNAT superfamily N-acetyltransferase
MIDVTRDGFTISDEPVLLDHDAIWAFISQAYWAKARTREQHERALAHSLCLGVYEGERQIGFARVVTDYAITAHIADVYILEPYRGRGLSKWLVQTILEHPELALVRRFTLNTDDAHGLYAQFGFTPLRKPEAMMELWRGGAW